MKGTDNTEGKEDKEKYDILHFPQFFSNSFYLLYQSSFYTVTTAIPKIALYFVCGSSSTTRNERYATINKTISKHHTIEAVSIRKSDLKGKHNNNRRRPISPFSPIVIHITTQLAYKEKKTTLTPNGHLYKNKWKGSNAGNKTGTKGERRRGRRSKSGGW